MKWQMVAGGGALLGVAACVTGPGGLLKEATGSVSQTLCSKAFVAGLKPEDVYAEHLRPEPGMGLISWALDYDVDRDAQDVRTRVFGVVRSRSVYAGGRGCTLVYTDGPGPSALTPRAHSPALISEIAGPEVVVAADPALTAALDAAFAEPGPGKRLTKAVIVLKDGRVIAERYAEGIGQETPLLSHSVAKSVVNALVGLLVRDGKLSLDETVLTEGPGAPVTVEQLLRMNAGFGFDEGRGASKASHIWYTKADMAAASETASRVAPPGETWGYCSRCYMLLSRIIGERIGGGPQGVKDFAQAELFDPLGMDVTLEFDASGTLMGANAMYASARDWARFGLLYLEDGMAGDTRLLPEGWVAASVTPTGETGYGAGFWLNTTDRRLKAWNMNWGIPGAPADAYMARGYMGQYVVIVPSADLVVVRFGQSHGSGAGIESVGQLVADVIAATAPADKT